VVDWTFLHLTIANWSFLVFASILGALIAYLTQRTKSIF
jgi:membrane protease YdiL (CAAX protease family)